MKKIMIPPDALTVNKSYHSYLRTKIKRLKEIIDVLEDSASHTCIASATLTMMKKLCSNRIIFDTYIFYLCQQTHHHIVTTSPKNSRILKLASAVMNEIQYIRNASAREKSNSLLQQVRNFQSETRSGMYGALIRTIISNELLILETGLMCFMNANIDYQRYAYAISRDYAEQYESQAGTGLIKKSLPALSHILFFWETLDNMIVER